jgi:hypothetical protein
MIVEAVAAVAVVIAATVVIGAGIVVVAAVATTRAGDSLLVNFKARMPPGVRAFFLSDRIIVRSSIDRS